MGTHLRVLSKSYLMNTNMTGFRCFSKIFAFLCFGRVKAVLLRWCVVTLSAVLLPLPSHIQKVNAFLDRKPLELPGVTSCFCSSTFTDWVGMW